MIHPIEAYVQGQDGLDLVERDESEIAYNAWSTTKAGSQIGLGSCAADNETMPDLFVLQFSDTPERACGDGGFDYDVSFVGTAKNRRTAYTEAIAEALPELRCRFVLPKRPSHKSPETRIASAPAAR